MKNRNFFLLVLACTFYMISCAKVLPHQRAYLSQPDMELSSKTIEKPEMNFESYREGASGGNGGKVGGGCGCN
jgi:hypothetical protein